MGTPSVARHWPDALRKNNSERGGIPKSCSHEVVVRGLLSEIELLFLSHVDGRATSFTPVFPALENITLRDDLAPFSFMLASCHDLLLR